ncbi:MAG: glycosyltransferase family 2 protein [Microgenomates group bacterium]|nr:glycosyltransferase family 2 protein [Microgenomates group bacterium]
MGKKIVTSTYFNYLSDIFIPAISWALITLPLWLSPFHPALVAYFIIAFDLYFFYKGLTNVYYASKSYKEIFNKEKVKFYQKKTLIHGGKKIYHVVIIPNYKEPVYKLEATIKSLLNNDYPYKDKIYLVLAFEKREKEAKIKAKILTKKFNQYFSKIFTTFHEVLENEIPGKASNQTFATKIIYQFIKDASISSKNTLITICDADSHLPKNYFSYLTYEYLKDKNRNYHFYWAPVLLYNNFWQLPIVVRIQATISSILRLAFLSDKENLIQISTYSTSLWLLNDLGYWDVDIIPEDWHVYLQAFFKYGAKVKTQPLFTIISGDAVYAGSVFKTLINRYEQEKRWAWGVSDVGYAIKKFFSTPQINPFLKIKKILYLAETHLFWPTSFFILTLSSSIPPLINPVFKRTVMGFLLPKLSGLILTLTSFMLVFYVYLDIQLRKKIKVKTTFSTLPMLIIQWYFLPIVSFLFSSLPALESHTRILFRKKLKYKVTEKV